MEILEFDVIAPYENSKRCTSSISNLCSDTDNNDNGNDNDNDNDIYNDKNKQDRGMSSTNSNNKKTKQKAIEENEQKRDRTRKNCFNKLNWWNSEFCINRKIEEEFNNINMALSEIDNKHDKGEFTSFLPFSDSNNTPVGPDSVVLTHIPFLEQVLVHIFCVLKSFMKLMLFCYVLCCYVQNYFYLILSYCIVLYLLYCIVLYCIISYCIVCIVLYLIALCCIELN